MSSASARNAFGEGAWLTLPVAAMSAFINNTPIVVLKEKGGERLLPIWIGVVGSTDPQARTQSAADLIRAIDAAQSRARETYGEVPTPRLHARFDKARAVLRKMMIEP